MTELEFIEEIAEGNLTKNDIIKYLSFASAKMM